MHDIRPLTLKDVPDAGALLGRAFCDNPAYRAILPHLSDAGRAKVVSRVKHGFAAAGARWEQAHGVWVHGQMAGASLVCAPGQYPHRLSAFLWHAWGCSRSGWRGIVNFLKADAFITKHHIREPHYYLFVLGVDPTYQRLGVGRALLGSLSDRADADGLPSYLETDKPSSVELYRSVGFQVLSEDDVPGVPGMHLWRMRRPPAFRGAPDGAR